MSFGYYDLFLVLFFISYYGFSSPLLFSYVFIDFSSGCESKCQQVGESETIDLSTTL